MPDQNQEQGPPDLLDMLKKVFGSKKSNQAGGTDESPDDDNSHITRFVSFTLGLIVLLWALSGIFVVGPAEEAAVLRFGKYIATVGPGPHWIPRFVDSKYTVDVQQVRNFSSQAEMLTKDENIVNVDLAVQYRIADLQNFLFNVVDPVTTLKQATASALRQVVGQMTLDAVLTTGREALRDRVKTQLEKTLGFYRTGLAITDVNLQPVKPPEAVTAAFDDAIKAREDKQSYINKANAYVRQATSRANGKIARLTQEAEAYKQEVVLRAQGDTARYLALVKPYEQEPVVMKKRLYLDTMADVLSHTSNIVVESNNSNILYLPLEQILARSRAKPTLPEPKVETQINQQQSAKRDENTLDYGPSSGYGGYSE